MNVVGMVEQALEAANRKSREEKNGKEHRERSARFVRALALILKREEGDLNSIEALYKPLKDDSENRRKSIRLDFGMEELLFDILVCKTGKTKSSRGKEELTYIEKGIWAVESELARNSREALYDFNKLVLADAEKKLFVGPQEKSGVRSGRAVDDEEFLAPLLKSAGKVRGDCYVVLIPHPSTWKKGERLTARGWRYKRGKWLKIG